LTLAERLCGPFAILGLSLTGILEKRAGNGMGMWEIKWGSRYDWFTCQGWA